MALQRKHKKLGELILVDESNKVCFICCICKYSVFSSNQFEVHLQTHFLEVISFEIPDDEVEPYSLKTAEISSDSSDASDSVLLPDSFTAEANVIAHEELQKGGLAEHSFQEESNHDIVSLSDESDFDEIEYESPDSVSEKLSSAKKHDEKTEEASSSTSVRCLLCSSSFNNEVRYINHIETHKSVPRGSYQCAICNKPHEQLWALKNHLSNMHDPEKAFPCEVCGQRYTHQWRLYAHQRRDHNMNVAVEHRCKDCSKQFPDSTSLYRHILSHRGIKRYECKICLKKFTQSPYLRIHMRGHNNERPYACTICDRTFTSKNKQQLHIKWHTDPRPHRCEECDRSFSNKGLLRNHVRSVHTHDKPFQCDACGVTFSSTKLLSQHKFVHRETKQFPCRFCPKEFSQSAGRRIHEKKVHNAK